MEITKEFATELSNNTEFMEKVHEICMAAMQVPGTDAIICTVGKEGETFVPKICGVLHPMSDNMDSFICKNEPGAYLSIRGNYTNKEEGRINCELAFFSFDADGKAAATAKSEENMKDTKEKIAKMIAKLGGVDLDD